MNGIVGFFCTNADVFREGILDRVRDKSALFLVSRAVNQATRYIEENGTYRKLEPLLRSVLTENALSDDHGEILKALSSRVRYTVEELSRGSAAVPINGSDVVDQIKRVLASLSSADLVVSQISDFRSPLGSDLANEIRDATSVYTMLSQYLVGADDVVEKEVVEKFRDLPRHYIQHLFDLLSTRKNIEREKAVSLVRAIHEMLCDGGEMRIARLICSKTCAFLKESMPHQSPELPGTSDPMDEPLYIHLYHMLARQGDYGVSMDVINELEPSIRHRHHRRLISIVSGFGDFDGAFGLIEQHTSAGDSAVRDDLFESIYGNAVRQKEWGYVVKVLEACSTRSCLGEINYISHAVGAIKAGQYHHAVQIARCVANDPDRSPDGREHALVYIALSFACNCGSRDDILAVLQLIDDAFLRSQGFGYGLFGVSLGALWGRPHFIQTRDQDNLQEMVDEFSPYVAQWPEGREEDGIWMRISKDDIWLEILKKLYECDMSFDLLVSLWKIIPWTGELSADDLAIRCIRSFAPKDGNGDFLATMKWSEVLLAPEVTREYAISCMRCIRDVENHTEEMRFFLERYGQEALPPAPENELVTTCP